jgi:hypothetical protein
LSSSELQQGGQGSYRAGRRLTRRLSRLRVVEAALWSAINGLQERAATFRRLASGGANGLIFRERADITERQAGVLHDLLRTLIENATVG